MKNTKYFPLFALIVILLASLACTVTFQPPVVVATNESPATVTEPNPTQENPPVVENNPAASACRKGNWLENAKAATTDVAALVSLLDRDFSLDQGGQWSEPGFTVPAGSVFWTDLFDNAKALPKGVAPVRTQGGWGVYVTSVDYVVPADNGGGRFLRLCK